MILLVTMITSSAVVANSLIARYTACRSALYTNQCQVKQLLTRVKYTATYILVLEELRSAKEQRSGLLGIECFADIEKVYDPSEKSSAFPRTYGGFIEDAGLLNDGSLVVVIGAEAALLILFGYERHCVQSSERVSPTYSRRGRLVTRRLLQPTSTWQSH